jgi:hypothetical protein
MFIAITRKLSRYLERKTRAVEQIKVSAEEVRELKFYQFKSSTADFFFNKTGRTDVRVRDTPHFSLACALVSGDPSNIATAEAFYRDYLNASWGASQKEKLEKRISDFRTHFLAVRNNKVMPVPILTRLLEDDSLFVVDGNHRFAFAAALGKPIWAELWQPQDAFLEFSRVKEFYGTGNRNLPYQSIFLGQREVIAGRRRDAIDRLALLPGDAIKGKTVLDVASNIGMSSLIARSMGANSCLGLEVSPRMVDLAARFAMFDGFYPAVRFRQFDIDSDDLDSDTVFDTAFIFSIYNHLKRPEKLIELADNNIAKYVIF